MKIFAETDRLILREMLPEDEAGMFALDNDADVHKYLGNKPISTLLEARNNIDLIRQQYVANGIGRWAVVAKETGDFMGWSGLKLIKEEMNNHINFHDVGYRLIKKYWNKGYATESARAALDYGFNTLNLQTIYGIANINNAASINALQKIGLTKIETFTHNNEPHYWLSITKPWQLTASNKKAPDSN